jgi:DNA-binding response OmpR family regulator
MDNTQLHIIGSKSFFNLLKEIDDKHTISFFDNINKNYLSNSSKEDKTVRIIFPEKLNLNLPSIFLLNDKQFFQKNKLKLLDFNVNLSLPIDFLSFVEILRILVIKYKFSQKSKIKIKNYLIDSNQKTISINNLQCKLTEKELQFILILIEKNGLSKKNILEKVWKYKFNLDSHAFETNLHRLRKKMTICFKDNSFITEKNSFYYI